MENYLITFDPDKEPSYAAVLHELVKLEAICILPGIWHLRYSNTDAAKLLSYFQRLIGKKDPLLIVRVSDWAGLNLVAVPESS